MAAKLDLAKEVLFGGKMSREEYQQELGRTHLYLLPSRREMVGLTMLKAMLAGCVPIVADNGGPRLTVTEDCGYKIPVTTQNQMADEIADIIVTIDRDRKIIAEKGARASERVAAYSAEERYRHTVNAVYAAIIRKHP